ISARHDAEVLSGANGEDAVDLPVADDVVGKPVAGRKLLAGAERKLIDRVGGEHLRNAEAGGAAAAFGVVRIFRNSALDAEVAVAAFIERLAPGIGDGITEAGGELPRQRSLEGIVGCAGPAVVPGFFRRGIRERLAGGSGLLPSGERGRGRGSTGVVI